MRVVEFVRRGSRRGRRWGLHRRMPARGAHERHTGEQHADQNGAERRATNGDEAWHERHSSRLPAHREGDRAGRPGLPARERPPSMRGAHRRARSQPQDSPRDRVPIPRSSAWGVPRRLRTARTSNHAIRVDWARLAAFHSVRGPPPFRSTYGLPVRSDCYGGPRRRRPCGHNRSNPDHAAAGTSGAGVDGRKDVPYAA